MPEAYIVDAVRIAVGRKNGYLAGEHPVDVAAHVLNAIIGRTGLDPNLVEDVIFGTTDAVGPQAGDIARLSWLAAGLPEHVPGVTLDRQCGSSQQAVHFAAQAVMSGTQDVVVAGGVQLMSVVPINYAWTAGAGLAYTSPFESKGWVSRYGSEEISQFAAADMIAEKWEIGREEMEHFALSSHEKAIGASDTGRFDAEISPYLSVTVDEAPRRDTTLERMAGLAPLRAVGRTTAALSSQIADGAAALLVASEAAVASQNLKPRARIHAMAVRGDDPIMMLTAPIPATRIVLEKARLTVDDIGLFEINEAFASVVLAWMKELKPDPGRVNVNGGAIALGHPIGASGARLMTSLVHELERRNERYGLQVMCEGGGQANATIIENLAYKA